jgi:divalent metal cation (Fe/Co/Zn/Cd) transporter
VSRLRLRGHSQLHKSKDLDSDDGNVYVVDKSLAGAVLLGLILNAAFGWWSDPVAVLAMTLIITKEGLAKMKMRMVRMMCW